LSSEGVQVHGCIGGGGVRENCDFYKNLSLSEVSALGKEGEPIKMEREGVGKKTVTQRMPKTRGADTATARWRGGGEGRSHGGIVEITKKDRLQTKTGRSFCVKKVWSVEWQSHLKLLGLMPSGDTDSIATEKQKTREKR